VYDLFGAEKEENQEEEEEDEQEQYNGNPIGSAYDGAGAGTPKYGNYDGGEARSFWMRSTRIRRRSTTRRRVFRVDRTRTEPTAVSLAQRCGSQALLVPIRPRRSIIEPSAFGRPHGQRIGMPMTYKYAHPAACVPRVR